MKKDSGDNPQETADSKDKDETNDAENTEYKEDTEDTEYKEDTEDTEDTEYKEETEETEETEEAEDIDDEELEEYDDTTEYIINKDIKYELKNEEYNNNNFNKFQEENNNQMIYLILNANNNKKSDSKNKCNNGLNLTKHPINKKTYKFYNKYSINEKKYFDILSEEDKAKLIENEDIVENTDITYGIPMRFKILNSDINIRTKKSIIWKIESLNKMSSNSSEYYKLSSWISSLNNIPFNKFYEIPIKITDGNEKICNFLNNIRVRMDETIFGHKDAKEQIIRVLAQLISFPRATGYIIGIQGSAGVGKTKLIKEGICNALNYPNAFISLSGTDDSSFLKGHSYTYEGSLYGKICESLMKTGIMNPLFLFDELDKVSNTYKGQEIINTLIHITDPVQNDKFNDRYFEEIDIDISRSMIIFTYNDDSLINPILKDRMIVINVNGYDNEEKLILAADYIVPEILKQYNLNKGDIIFSTELLRHIINNIEKEDGVRNLKRAINNIVSWINMMRYVPIDLIKISIPYTVSILFYDTYCKKNNNTISIAKYNSIYL
jgi:ATP-dependent Lon protease